MTDDPILDWTGETDPGPFGQGDFSDPPTRARTVPDHDPMLDGIQRYTIEQMVGFPEGFEYVDGDDHPEVGTVLVKFSDLPALLAAAREDERQRVTSDFAEYLRHMEEWQAGYNKGHAAGVEQGQRDEREACISVIQALPSENPVRGTIYRRAAVAALCAREEKP